MIKVLIVGQKTKRREELERAFAGRARLAFHFEGNLHRLQDAARGADRVFVTVNGTGHKDTNAIRKVVPPDRIQYVHGGGESLRAALDAFLPKGEPQ